MANVLGFVGHGVSSAASHPFLQLMILFDHQVGKVFARSTTGHERKTVKDVPEDLV